MVTAFQVPGCAWKTRRLICPRVIYNEISVLGRLDSTVNSTISGIAKTEQYHESRKFA